MKVEKVVSWKRSRKGHCNENQTYEKTKETQQETKRESEEADVPNAWYSSLKRRVENLEGDVLALEATLGALISRVHSYLKGKNK